jgi:hypothetical protein
MYLNKYLSIKYFFINILKFCVCLFDKVMFSVYEPIKYLHTFLYLVLKLYFYMIVPITQCISLIKRFENIKLLQNKHYYI